MQTINDIDLQKWSGKMRRLITGSFRLAIVLAIATTTLLGQDSTATLGGRVFDSQSKIIRKAAVAVTSEETGTQWKAVTNNDGDWRVDSLPVGHYRFQVVAPGFKTLDHSAIELQVSDQKFVDATLAIGAMTETVEVVGSTPLVDTTSAISGVVITTAELEDLPSQTNSPTALVGLTPGVVFAYGSGGGASHLWSNIGQSAVQVDFSGSGSNAVNFQMEGSSDTNGSGQVAFIPPMEAVTEERVSKNAYDASIGRTAAGTVDITVKSGSKAFHGELYEFNQNNTLNAKQYNQTALAVPAVHTNEYGGSVGGPVWIPKLFDGRAKHTFFFFNFDGIRNKSPLTTGTVSVPDADERKGDFGNSFTLNNGTNYTIQIYDPTTYNPKTGVRNLFPASSTGPGQMIPTVSPIAKAFYALIPLPDLPHDAQGNDSNNYGNQSVKFDPFKSLILRVDNAWNDYHHSYVELRYNNLTEVQSSAFGLTNILSGIDLNRKNLGMTLDHSWVVSPRLVVDMRGNITAYDTESVSPTYGINPTTFGFPSALVAFQSAPSIPAITGLPTPTLGTSQAPTYTNDIIYEGKGTVTHVVGGHAMKYGGEYMVQQEADGNIGTTTGTFAFGTNWTTQNPNATAAPGVGSSLASFDLGLPTGGSVGTPATAFWSQPYVAIFFQDDWRVTNKLTLNLGLRWDEQRPLTERHNKFFSIFDPNANIAPVTAVAQPAYAAEIAGSSTNAGIQFLQQHRSDPSTFVARGEIQYAGVNGTSRAVTNSTLKYFQPRVGFAYAINPKTTIRGGIGRFVEANFVISHGNQTGYSATTPYLATQDNYADQYATLSNPFPSGLVPVTGNSLGALTQVGSITSYYAPTVPRQYNDEVSAHLQRQEGKYLFELGGTLNITHGILVGDDVDEPSTATWMAALGPQFDSTGRPLDTLSGNTQVPNPFFGAPNVSASLAGTKTVTAYSLAKPNPLVDISENRYDGKNTFYSMQARAERRYSNGFGILSSFTWGKDMSQTSHILPQAVSEVYKRQLSGSDQRFLWALTPTYTLPIGRGQLVGNHMNKWLDLVVGGWKLSAIYTFNSGTPVSLPTNSSFFQGGDPGAGITKSRQQWFNTSKFQPFPTRSTTVAQIAAYPAWTGVGGLPGASWSPVSSSDASKNGVYNDFGVWQTNNDTTYGNIRNPYYTNLDAGLRKSFPLEGAWSFEIRFDAFNALNHPVLGGPNTTPGNAYFGVIGGTAANLVSQANTPRAIQLAGKLYF